MPRDNNDKARRAVVRRVAQAEAELERAREARRKMIRRDRSDGLTVRQIGKLYGMHWTRVAHWLDG